MPVPYGSKLHISPTNNNLLAAQKNKKQKQKQKKKKKKRTEKETMIQKREKTCILNKLDNFLGEKSQVYGQLAKT